MAEDEVKTNYTPKPNFFQLLKGRKTYLMAGALALWAVLGFVLGRGDIDVLVRLLVEAGAIASLRHAIN